MIMTRLTKKLLLLWLVVIPCHAFVTGHRRSLLEENRGVGGAVGVNPAASTSTKHDAKNKFPVSTPRGGGPLSAGLSDYSGAARALFGNIIGPAAMLSGGLVPMSFLAPPLPQDTYLQKRLHCLYSILSVLSLCNELAAIIYATVASNKLTEIALQPASSVFALIQRDFELSWVATNVHFIFGLFGFMAMVMIRAYTLFPARLNLASAGLAGSLLLGMLSIVNRGIAAGDATGERFGSNLGTLLLRYVLLSVKQLVRGGGGILLWAALAVGVVSSALAVREILSPEKI